ncbi:MAG TPA: Calx-beta domain-containing protein [Pyrinomonadaceae bacterium]
MRPGTRLAAAVCMSAALLCALAWLLPTAGTPAASAQGGATPTPTPFASFVRQVEVNVRNLAYSPATQTIFASVYSFAGANGNSVLQIDPATGAVGSPVFVGSDPSRMAFSDDGLTMYVVLEGANAVRRFDVAAGTPGAQYSITRADSCANGSASYVAVMPGRPQTVAVTRSCGGTVVLDDGVPRPQEAAATLSGQPHFGVSPSRLYTTVRDFAVRKYALTAAGLTEDGGPALLTKGGETQFDRTRGLIFSARGDVINPETGQTLAQLPGTGQMAIDPAAGRVYFLGPDPSGAAGDYRITGYDMTTFQPVGYTTVTGAPVAPTEFIRWGSNGFAFFSFTAQGGTRRVFLVQTQLVDPAAALPTPTPTPAATPTPTPTPEPATLVRKVNVRANDLVYNAATQSLYVSVPSAAGAGGDSVTPIDPETLALGTPVAVGSEPELLALADDGRTLYVHLAGPNAVRRVDLQTQTAGLQFALANGPGDMDVMPGHPETLAVSGGVDPDPVTGIIREGKEDKEVQEARQSAAVARGVTVYDDGVARPEDGTDGPFYKGVNPVEFASASVLYGFNTLAKKYELVKFDVDADGVTTAEVTPNLTREVPGHEMLYAGGRLYLSGGEVLDPVAKKLLGTFSGVNGSVIAVDTALGRAFFATTNGRELIAFDLNTFLPVGRVNLPITGFPRRLVRWGTNGLALRVSRSSFDTTEGDIYVIQSALVSSSQPIATSLQFTSAAVTRPEAAGTALFFVTRTGDLSQTTTVDYTTADGTATSDEDYTETTGKLTFAPGETSKSITVPITQDNIFEGDEAFTLTLGTPSGGAVVTGPSSATINITDDDPWPTVNIADARVAEGHAGTKEAEFLVTLKSRSIHTVTVNYATADGTATAGSDYEAASGTLTFPPLATSAVVKVKIFGDTQVEPDETFAVTLSAPANAVFVDKFVGTGTIANDEGPTVVRLASAAYAVDERAGQVVLTVTRSGDLSAPASVAYATSDGTANEISDYTLTLGTLDFAPGEFEKALPVLVTNDVFNETRETFVVTLSAPSGATLDAPSAATVEIGDDEVFDTSNPVVLPGFSADFFVRQHYHDFLNREPDAAGLAFWKSEFAQCGGTDAQCNEVKRVNVSAAFFLSIEFQETGYFVYLLHQAAFDEREGLRLRTFLADSQEIGRGVQVGVGDWRAQIDANKRAFVERFAARPAFAASYGGKTNAQYVDALNANTYDPRAPSAGGALSAAARDALVADLDQSRKTRAEALRAVAEHAEFSRRQTNYAFVLMEYFGYLRRNPNDPPDSGFDGYYFWLGKLDEFGGDYVRAEMVKAFINSAEYRRRFGP